LGIRLSDRIGVERELSFLFLKTLQGMLSSHETKFALIDELLAGKRKVKSFATTGYFECRLGAELLESHRP
jgi:hypothetical protein